MLILNVTFNLVALPLLPTPLTFNSQALFVLAWWMSSGHTAVLAKTMPNPQSSGPKPGRWRAHLPQRWRTLDELGVGATVLQSQMETLGAKLEVWLTALQRRHNREKRLWTITTTTCFHHSRWNCGTLCCSTAGLEVQYTWLQPSGDIALCTLCICEQKYTFSRFDCLRTGRSVAWVLFKDGLRSYELININKTDDLQPCKLLCEAVYGNSVASS